MNFNRILHTAAVVLLLCVSAQRAQAIPVDPNLWQAITLTDGTTIQAQLMGDEWFSYYRDAQGNVYTLDAGQPNARRYAKRNAAFMAEQVKRANALREADAVNVVAHPQPVLKKNGKKKTMNEKDFDAFRGQKRGLIILVNFQDVKYTTEEPKAFYSKVANNLNYQEGYYRLSIRDYFRRQSYGKFDLVFDVVGPVTVSQNMQYYGAPNGSSNDTAPAEMVKEAVELVNDSVRFSDYDWDGDGTVENVFVLYAGYNQAEGGGENTIWPHKWALSSGTGSALTLQNMTINIYACSSEMRGRSGGINCGIGTFCHEFSHCMGFPDLYDTSYSGNVGVGCWDLMGSGSYRESGFNPIDYSGFEKWTAGWLEPIELTDPVLVKNMKPIEENGEMYFIDCGSTTQGEYYILENRDVEDMYPYREHPQGLLITHIDYNAYAWYYNRVNTFGTYYEYDYNQRDWVTKQNQHLRWQIIAADNNMQQYQTQEGDVYPYNNGYSNNNELSSTSTPQMVWYNGTETASAFDDHAISDITRNDDGTIDFSYRGGTRADGVYQSLFFDERSTGEMKYNEGTYNIYSNIIFPNGEWRALWLPFDMTQEELQAALGTSVKVATFSNVNIDEANNAAEVNFKTTNDGIKAFQPCLIRVVNRDFEFAELGMLMQKEVKASTGTPNVTIDDFTFRGIKKAGSVSLYNPSASARGYLFYENMPNVLPASAYVNAYDAIFATTYEGTVSYTFDKVVTAIDGIATQVDGISTHNVYDLQGNIVRRNAKGTQRLPAGVYIYNGKKVVVK